MAIARCERLKELSHLGCVRKLIPWSRD